MVSYCMVTWCQGLQHTHIWPEGTRDAYGTQRHTQAKTHMHKMIKKKKTSCKPHIYRNLCIIYSSYWTMNKWLPAFLDSYCGWFCFLFSCFSLPLPLPCWLGVAESIKTANVHSSQETVEGILGTRLLLSGLEASSTVCWATMQSACLTVRVLYRVTCYQSH